MNASLRKPKTFLMRGVRRIVGLLEHSVAAWTILAVSLLLTFGAWLISNRMYKKQMQDRFAFRVSRVVESIEERLLEYEQVLRGGVGLYAASDSVSRTEWKSYVDNCEISKYFPGIQGMGVAVPVTPNEKLQHEAAIRKEGFEDYHIRPTTARDFYTSIVYLEPFDWRNQRAFGYDMYSNPIRRESMDRAIETGQPSMSGMVTLVQETETDVQRGWLFYLPMFKKSAQGESLTNKRTSPSRENLTGFVYAAFRAEDLMKGILNADDNDVKFEIFDSNQPEKDQLLFDSDKVCHLDSGAKSAFSSEVNMSIRGREWTLFFESCPALFVASGNHQSSFVAFGGLTVDFLLFLVIAVIGHQKRRAVEIADEMTKDVRAREELISEILANASEAIVTIDENGCIELANRVAITMFCLPDFYQGIRFDNCLENQSWVSLADKLERAPDNQYKCTVDAKRGHNLSFVCRLNLATFVANNSTYHILVARDETNRLESDRKMAEINGELIKASSTAAKVELANGVLHNVGNIVNSINVSTTVIKKQVQQLSVSKLDRVCKLIAENETGFGEFVQNDQRGQKIPNYLLKVNDALVDEKLKIDEELHDLVKNVLHIKEVVTAQQSAAKSNAAIRLLSPEELLDDAVIANKANLANHDIEITKEVQSALPELYSDKHKILQILVNLIKNANDALVENQSANPQIITKVKRDNDSIVFEVVDNGIGISQDKLDQIFQHGFTTKQSGHGFGLHSSVKAATDLNGTLNVTSQGIGQGATFRLSIPISAPATPSPTSTKREPSTQSEAIQSEAIQSEATQSEATQSEGNTHEKAMQ